MVPSYFFYNSAQDMAPARILRSLPLTSKLSTEFFSILLTPLADKNIPEPRAQTSFALFTQNSQLILFFFVTKFTSIVVRIPALTG